MNNDIRENELLRTSQTVILLSYTAFSVILIGEALLLSWEKWVLILMVIALAIAWTVHIRQAAPERVRLWIYSLMMMAVFFFYGTHQTSTFDLAVVMLVVVMIYTMTGIKAFITLCQITYFITFAYELIVRYMTGGDYDILVITRSMMHVVMIIMGGWIGKIIIDTWDKVLEKSRVEIKELKEATERLDHFLANVSHEIRTPTNAVMGLSAVLEKEDLPKQASESIRAISRAGHRVSEQIGDILDFTEIDMDKLSVNNENYLTGSLVNDLLVQISTFENPDLDFVVDLEAGVPAELVGDASKIKKILWHLINNGFKYSKEGGVYVHLHPIKRDYGINLLIEVKDTGMGMDDDEIEHIYEQFYQAQSGRTTVVGGLGLGIPIVNGFVKAMGGVMAIESDLGEGTTVRVSIPQQVAEGEPCISVKNRENCVAAGFLGFMTTGHPRVREFYMEMIGHLVEGLNVPFHRVQSRKDLEKLLETKKISHLFVGTGEYLENREYIDSLADKLNVAIVKDRGFNESVGKGLSLLPKPFYGVQVANFLNQAFKEYSEDLSEEKVIFPDVRALVVDDEPMNLMVARGILEGYGMKVSTVLSGFEAIEACDRNDYDIVFMDHMMPEMDGVEAMKRIRVNASKSKKELCIVALTANAISSAKEMFLSEGFDGFIPKPIEITEFERVLRRVLPKSLIAYTKVEKQLIDSPDDDGSINSAAKDGEEASGASVSDKVTAQKKAESADSGKDRITEKYLPIIQCGVDAAKGIKYCNKDEEFYDQLLAEYAKNRDKKINELRGYYNSENWNDYSIRVHAIKSTSKMIGALQLSEMAKELEDASKEGDKERIAARHPVFMPEYSALLYEISNLLDLDKKEDPGDGDADDDQEDVLEFGPEDGDILEFTP